MSVFISPMDRTFERIPVKTRANELRKNTCIRVCLFSCDEILENV
jgi:hypothetical protein